VHRDCAYRVIEFKNAFNEIDRNDHYDSRHCADDHRAQRIHERARRGDGNQACQHAIAQHARVWFTRFEDHDERGK
jgi:hypothetical protein